MFDIRNRGHRFFTDDEPENFPINVSISHLGTFYGYPLYLLWVFLKAGLIGGINILYIILFLIYVFPKMQGSGRADPP